MKIHDATAADWPMIVEFNLRLAEETEGKQLDAETLRRGVQALLAQPNHGRYFLARQDGRVVGQAMITFEWSDWRNGQIWWFQSVYVTSEHRRQGIFRGLFEHVRSLAESTAGVIGLRLYVEQQNVAAQQVYRALGMNEAGYLVLERML